MLEIFLCALQDAVRGDHVEVTKLLLDHGGKIFEDGKVNPAVKDPVHTHLFMRGALFAICKNVKQNADVPCLVQLVDLGDSRLSGKMQDIPENIVDLEVDWEIDPEALQVLEKIGVPVHATNSQCW